MSLMGLIGSDETARLYHDGGVDLASDPLAVRRLGAVLAGAVSGQVPVVIAHWADIDDAVLAHAFAEELGAPRHVIEEDLGLLTITPPVKPGDRVILIGIAPETFRPVHVARVLLEQRDAVLVGTIRLVEEGPGFGLTYETGEA